MILKMRYHIMIIIALCASFACAQGFQSQWDKQNDRIWPGKSYWSAPIYDWRISNGRLECVTSRKDRYVDLLDYQTTAESEFKTEVNIGRLRDDLAGNAGFRFGKHDPDMRNYIHSLVWGKYAIEAGISSDGKLFFKDWHRWCLPSKKEIDISKETGFTGEVKLRLEVTKDSDADTHTATLTAICKRKAESIKLTVDSAAIAGNLLLYVDCDAKIDQPSFYFKKWKLQGIHLKGSEEQRWGPILWTQYTLSRDVLKLSVQMPPLGGQDSDIVELEVNKGKGWQKIAEAQIGPDARNAIFRVADWDSGSDTPYRAVYKLQGEKYYYEGIIAKDPVDEPELSVAGFTGNHDYGIPNPTIMTNLKKLQPDVLFFSGDQFYEGTGGTESVGHELIREPVDKAILGYLQKWYVFGITYKDILKDRPSVIIPDDHDVYMGNVWGEGGKRLPMNPDGSYKPELGGYVMPVKWLKVVERTQAGSLPDPYDPRPIKNDMSVYFTDMLYGRVSFAILEDRKFKSGPANYKDPYNAPGAVLLGERQLSFLEKWVSDWNGADMKCTLSQTVFGQCHSAIGDTDSNGWPAQGRDKALRQIRKGFALMYAGDNHLPTVVHHGIDDWEDAGVSFTVPSAYAGFPRSWHGEIEGSRIKKYGGLEEYYDKFATKSPLKSYPDYLGRFMSQFGHNLTFLAVANPEKHMGSVAGSLEVAQAKMSGFGLVRFNKSDQKITVECYRVLGDVDNPEDAQYEQWPVEIKMLDNYGRKPYKYLDEIICDIENPVIKVYDGDGELVYALRIRGKSFTPWVFEKGIYSVIVGDGDDEWKRYEGLTIE
jgi:alkaline phosphatase D